MSDDYKPLWSQFISVTPAMVTHEPNRTCLECKRSFYAARDDAKFCGQNCRRQASRRKDRARRIASAAITALDQMRRLVKDYPDVGIVASLELERVKSSLSVTIAAVTPKEE